MNMEWVKEKAMVFYFINFYNLFNSNLLARSVNL